jgi:hypothetical protein
VWSASARKNNRRSFGSRNALLVIISLAGGYMCTFSRPRFWWQSLSPDTSRTPPPKSSTPEPSFALLIAAACTYICTRTRIQTSTSTGVESDDLCAVPLLNEHYQRDPPPARHPNPLLMQRVYASITSSLSAPHSLRTYDGKARYFVYELSTAASIPISYCHLYCRRPRYNCRSSPAPIPLLILPLAEPEITHLSS